MHFKSFIIGLGAFQRYVICIIIFEDESTTKILQPPPERIIPLTDVELDITDGKDKPTCPDIIGAVCEVFIERELKPP